MGIEITALHWIYVTFILLIIIFMVRRPDTSLISIVGIFVIALLKTGSFISSIGGVFKACL